MAEAQTPPTDMLAGCVDVHKFVARNNFVVAALNGACAYPQGCELILHLVIRRVGSIQANWPHLQLEVAMGLNPSNGGNPLCSVRRYDGQPLEIDVIEASTTSNDRTIECTQRLWLSPLPPNGSVSFTLDWLALGVTGEVELDGRAINEGAARAEPYWLE